MFKKLKQKIEEGGEGGLEKVSFSPTKLPGSIVRSNSPRSAEIMHGSRELDLPPGQSNHTAQLQPATVLGEDEQVNEGNFKSFDVCFYTNRVVKSPVT